MTENLFDLKHILKTKGIIFCYSGPLSHGIMEHIGDTLKYKMEIETENTNVIHKVFAIFVEQVQNIMHYSDEEKLDEDHKTKLKSGIIVIGKDDQHYFVESGNIIQNNRKKKITQKLEKIKGMSKDELKNFYKEQLQKNPDPESKGAGLGLIYIARKASDILDYDIMHINNEYSFFSLRVVI